MSGNRSIPLVDRLVRAMIARRVPGAGTLRRMLGRFATTTAVTAITKYGSRFLLHPSDYIDSIVLREGFYESEVFEAIRQNLPMGAVVWDVGANFGLHGITLKLARPDISVVCFEPSPASAARVLINSELNGVAVDLVCVALGEVPGLQTLHVVSHGNPGMTTTVPWCEATYDRTLVCYSETGTRLVESGLVRCPTAIKLDVEGAERAALRGMAGLFSGPTVRTVVFEGTDELAHEIVKFGFRTLEQLKRNETTEQNLNNYIATR